MKASDYIAAAISGVGVNHIFGYTGGMVAHLIDSIDKNPSLEMINMITEQGAGFAAEGYAKNSNKLGVAIATSGPGAINLLTPMAGCYFDSVPVLFITGQVNSNEYRKFKKIRQNGFQEANIIDMANPITKYANFIDSPLKLAEELHKAMHIAKTGRKGPVLLDIPMDIQRAEINDFSIPSFEEKNYADGKNDSIVELIRLSKRPVLLVGGGVRLSGAAEELKEFLTKTQIPVVESLMGIDAVHFNYEYNSGFIGSYGNRYGNFTLANADVVLVLGSRLDLKQIGAHPELFARHAKIIQVDIDENELKKNDLSKITIHSDIKTFLKYMNELNFDLDIHDWRNQIKVWKSKYPTSKKRDGKDNVPNILVEKIFDHLTERDRISIDVGQHQMWVAQAAKIRKDQRLFFSGGLGAMGFALPCAIGLSITGGRAVVISGDGGFQMNIQEMEVIKRRNLPIKIIIMNNENLAMVRQFQELYMNANFPSTVKDYSAPNFAAVAQAYGIRSLTIKHDSIDHQFLSNFFADNTPALLDIRLDRFTQVEPKLLFGNPIENLSPLLSEQELKTNMVSE